MSQLSIYKVVVTVESRDFLDLLMKNSVFQGGGPLWATAGPKREFCQLWPVDRFFQAHKGDK